MFSITVVDLDGLGTWLTLAWLTLDFMKTSRRLERMSRLASEACLPRDLCMALITWQLEQQQSHVTHPGPRVTLIGATGITALSHLDSDLYD